MRHDTLDLDVRDVDPAQTGDGERMPRLCLSGELSDSEFEQRLRKPVGEQLSAEDIDIAFRYRSGTEDGTVTGVLSVANRTTGDLIFEVTTTAERIEDFVDGVQDFADRTGENRRYAVEFRSGDEPVISFEKEIFLVYGEDGTLLRHRSLIPNGIEI